MRAIYTLTYTESATYELAGDIQKMLNARRDPALSEKQREALDILDENVPSVDQYRITVSTVNGLQQAKYRSLWRQGIEYFTAETGYEIPLPTEENEKGEEVAIDIGDYADAVLTTSLSAAAALATLVKFETRKATPVITSAGITFASDEEWKDTGLPDDIATVRGWVENCSDSLQRAWSGKAYDANPGLWRQKNDEAAKNFDAVSVN